MGGGEMTRARRRALLRGLFHASVAAVAGIDLRARLAENHACSMFKTNMNCFRAILIEAAAEVP